MQWHNSLKGPTIPFYDSNQNIDLKPVSVEEETSLFPAPTGKLVKVCAGVGGSVQRC